MEFSYSFSVKAGGLISETFSLWLKSQDKGANHDPEYLLFT